MTNTLKINRNNNTIVMDRAFAKASEIVGSAEYNMLQTARRDYPTYSVVQRTIKRNPNKECYHGLTYEFMEDYIMTHGDAETVKKNYNEFCEMRLISQCHSKSFRYPVIKQWFLNQYPEIVRFGMCGKPEVVEVGQAQEANVVRLAG